MHGPTSRPFTLTLLFLALLAPASPAAADLWGTSVDGNNTAPAELADQYNRVFRFDNLGNKIGNDIGHASAGLNYPTGMAVAPNGNLFVSAAGIGSILVYDGQTGQPVSLGGGPAGFFTTLISPPAAPAQLAFGPDGDLYVSEFFGTSVRVYNPATGQRLPDAATGLISAGGLAFGPDGALFVGDWGPNFGLQPGKIVRVSNGMQSTYGISDMGMVRTPSALHFLPNGDLLFADLFANYIGRIAAGGFGFEQFASILPAIPNPLPPGVLVPSNNPSDIDFDQDGNLIVSILGLTNPPDNRGALLRYALDGTPLAPLAGGLESIGTIAWTPSTKTSSGDFDGDGNTDLADYAKWKGDFGKWVAAGNGADGNGDGIVDAGDYTVWRDALPGEFDGSAAASAVPEPSTAAFAVLGLLVALGRRTHSHFSGN